MGRNVQITQYIALKFEVVDTVFDDVSDADDTGKLAVPKYHQMTRAMMRHQSHCTFQIVLRRNGDKVTCHNFLHCKLGGCQKESVKGHDSVWLLRRLE